MRYMLKYVLRNVCFAIKICINYEKNPCALKYSPKYVVRALKIFPKICRSRAKFILKFGPGPAASDFCAKPCHTL